jgi:hypothetical protein
MAHKRKRRIPLVVIYVCIAILILGLGYFAFHQLNDQQKDSDVEDHIIK